MFFEPEVLYLETPGVGFNVDGKHFENAELFGNDDFTVNNL